MCNTTTLPCVTKSEILNSDLHHLTRIFNRWLKMLTGYGKLDLTEIGSDFTVISKVIKSEDIDKKVKRAVKRCRDYALAKALNLGDFTKALNRTLRIMCRAQEDRETHIIKKQRADQGMSERYRPLTKRLQKEKIRKIGKELIYTDSQTDDPRTNRLVRRIVEKRAAQTVHRIGFGRNRDNNRFRQSVRRATSFSLYNVNFTEYDAQKRVTGTHWKVISIPRKGKKMLKAKMSYNSAEEAMQACERYIQSHTDDPRPMTTYKCEHCGKWHIGHERMPDRMPEMISDEKHEDDTKIPA